MNLKQVARADSGSALRDRIGGDSVLLLHIDPRLARSAGDSCFCDRLRCASSTPRATTMTPRHMTKFLLFALTTWALGACVDDELSIGADAGDADARDIRIEMLDTQPTLELVSLIQIVRPAWSCVFLGAPRPAAEIRPERPDSDPATPQQVAD
jgi:hypothetical protein